ncbi:MULTISPECIES: IMPACT family protein [unclassified Halomonas]|uniref:IMPACT family protein n=1 Tax=unclassified Halomonas TaxID=2609666 RepID=UPI001C940BB4|nr:MULTISPECIES: YigZ family protein [unclassified Halomonas]MBY5923729.1 YigZ family protein [Halomonas sp. DP4Y7-2]MBY6230771.1 YigZ family protein [Halomonas sp. DP4Y7-1]
MRYPIPDLAAGEWHVAEIEVEKSRFITWVAHAPDVDAFNVLLAEARRQHPNASHHCSAYLAGPPGEQVHIGFSDDGEPGGTAGRPMFQALEGDGIGQTAAVVIRYFGGTKLGTGGLARAYTQALVKALETLPRRECVERRQVRIQVDFAGEADARQWCESRHIPVDAVDYAAEGVSLTLGWPTEAPVDLSELSTRLKGRIAIARDDDLNNEQNDTA